MMKKILDFFPELKTNKKAKKIFGMNEQDVKGYLIGLLILLFSFCIVYAGPGHEGLLPQPSQVSYPTDRAAARAALERQLQSYGAKVEDIYDLTTEDLSRLCGRGALWSRVFTEWACCEFIFWADSDDKIKVFDKDGNLLRYVNGTTAITNPFTFHVPNDVRSLAAKLQNGGALPNAYLVLFPLNCATLQHVHQSANPKHNISLLYFDPLGFVFSVNRTHQVTKGSVLHHYWTMDPKFYDEVTLRLTIVSKIPATLPPATSWIPDEVMRELLARQAILAYHKSDADALNLLSKFNSEEKTKDANTALALPIHGLSADEIQDGMHSIAQKVIEKQSSMPYASIKVGDRTLYICVLPKGQDDWYLYLTPTKPEEKKFAWEAISVGQVPGWTTNTDTGRDSDLGHKYAVWCANGMSDRNWKLDDPKAHAKFLRDFLFTGKYYSGVPSADFLRGVSFIQDHIDGHDPEVTAEFTRYGKEVSKYLTATKDAPVINQAAIDLWTAILGARPAEYKANDPDFREKFASTAFSGLYLGLTIPTFPREVFDYFHVGAQLLGSLKNANANSESDESETDYYSKLQEATTKCVIAAQRWIRRDLLDPATLPLAIEDESLEAKLEASERKQSEQVEALERRHAEQVQASEERHAAILQAMREDSARRDEEARTTREDMRAQQAAFMEALQNMNKRSRSGSSASGMSYRSHRSNRSHRSSVLTPAARARNVVPSELVAQNLEAISAGSATVHAASEHGTPSEHASETSSASTWHVVPSQE